MLPRLRGSVPRPPGGRFGASAATRRPRAAQAHASLGRAVRHRQGSEARDVQAGQQSRRGLQQRLEHPTATSLLPLRCFQVVRTPRSHTKSNHQGRVSLASAKPDPPSGATPTGFARSSAVTVEKGHGSHGGTMVTRSAITKQRRWQRKGLGERFPFLWLFPRVAKT
jgi:hypothetical protein